MQRRIGRVIAAAVVAAAAHVWTSASGRQDPAAIDRLIQEADDRLTAGSFDAMADAAESAVALGRAAGDRARLAQALFRLGQARFYQSRNREAQAADQEAVDLAAALGDRALRARALNGVGLALREQGEYDRAIELMTQALDAHRASGDRLEEVRVQRNIAVLYWQLGDFAHAETTARAAADLARAIGNKPFEVVTLQAYGSIVADAGRTREALGIERRAFAIANELKMPVLLIELNISIGDILDRLGDRTAALTAFMEALDASDRAGYAAGRAVSTGHAGTTYRDLGRIDEALEWLLRARGLFAALGDTAHVSNVIANESEIARALGDAGRLDEALATDRNAIDLLDRMRRAAVPTETTAGSVNAARSTVFLDAVAILAGRGRAAEAFDIAERYHARAFLDSLAGRDAADSRDDEEQEREHDLLLRAARLQRELWKPDLPTDRRRDIDAELTRVDDDAERLAGTIRRRSSAYALHDPRVLTAAAVQRELVDDRTVLVEYLLGEPRSYVWAISAHAVQGALLPGRKSLESTIARYRGALTTKTSALTLDRDMRAYRRAAAAAYAALVAPIEPALAGADRLVIVPDGALAYVPFEPLGAADGSSDRRMLVDRFDVSYVPSASAWSAIRAGGVGAPRPRTLLAVGDPPVGAPLPYSRAEIAAISRVFPVDTRTVFVGSDADEARVKAAPLGDYQYLHFATHGVLDAKNPARSGLVLASTPRSADGGLLQVREIRRLKLNADMVTLSACETGLGRLVNGEGVLGLTRAFFYAGARSVVVSLWDVNDRATADLMGAFYAGIRGGRSRASALRDAKRALAHGRRPVARHPYSWAAFVFSGVDK